MQADKRNFFLNDFLRFSFNESRDCRRLPSQILKIRESTRDFEISSLDDRDGRFESASLMPAVLVESTEAHGVSPSQRVPPLCAHSQQALFDRLRLKRSKRRVLINEFANPPRFTIRFVGLEPAFSPNVLFTE